MRPTAGQLYFGILVATLAILEVVLIVALY